MYVIAKAVKHGAHDARPHFYLTNYWITFQPEEKVKIELGLKIYEIIPHKINELTLYLIFQNESAAGNVIQQILK